MTAARDPLAEALAELTHAEGAQAFRAILARHGLAVVPVDLTWAMLRAAEDNALLGLPACYRAMITAAREAPHGR